MVEVSARTAGTLVAAAGVALGAPHALHALEYAGDPAAVVVHVVVPIALAGVLVAAGYLLAAERLVPEGEVARALGWLLVGVAALAVGGYVAAGVVLPALSSITLAAPIIIVLGVAVVAALAVTSAPSHVAGVLTLSILGFMVAIFYILANAPDLALTQLVIETLVLVLFLLVLNKLPAFYGDLKRRQIVTDTIISGVVGVTVFLTVLVSTAATPGKPIYTYFLERGGVPTEHGQWLLEWGGGSNIVNVILVDFRAFDTMGEISVVAMAALSIITMIAMRQRGETQ